MTSAYNERYLEDTYQETDDEIVREQARKNLATIGDIVCIEDTPRPEGYISRKYIFVDGSYQIRCLPSN